ncbi:MAG: argininosuccinate lyase, partial [Saprospiraceae bacterium]|nr:argininosuccinate lyase [Saprospiraceae bacterium]
FAAGERLPHTHLGSIGNLGTARIAAEMAAVWDAFGFAAVQEAEARLLG